MIILKGLVCPDAKGLKHFSRRTKEYPEVFEKATGEQLYPGSTLNVNVSRQIEIKEHFRIHGKELNESEGFLLEICRINGFWAYRIVRLNAMGFGGHGDNILEIACSKKIPSLGPGTEEAVFHVQAVRRTRDYSEIFRRPFGRAAIIVSKFPMR